MNKNVKEIANSHIHSFNPRNFVNWKSKEQHSLLEIRILTHSEVRLLPQVHTNGTRVSRLPDQGSWTAFSCPSWRRPTPAPKVPVRREGRGAAGGAGPAPTVAPRDRRSLARPTRPPGGRPRRRPPRSRPSSVRRLAGGLDCARATVTSAARAGPPRGGLLSRKARAAYSRRFLPAQHHGSARRRRCCCRSIPQTHRARFPPRVRTPNGCVSGGPPRGALTLHPATWSH